MSVNNLDQYFTHVDLASEYVSQVLERWHNPDVLFIEPSAGTGSFLNRLWSEKRKVRAMDIAPKGVGIVRGDFLKQEAIFSGKHAGIVIIGNPPFGKNASFAVRFFNHSAKYADEIAFIVPRSFRKISIQKRLDRHFHLSRDDDVIKNAFLLNGKPYDVPCAWQIWTKKAYPRLIPTTPCVNHLISYTSPPEADFAIRRVGFYAGRVITKQLMSLSVSTHYFIREIRGGVINILRNINWQDIVRQTAGVRSLSKAEIATKLSDMSNIYV